MATNLHPVYGYECVPPPVQHGPKSVRGTQNGAAEFTITQPFDDWTLQDGWGPAATKNICSMAWAAPSAATGTEAVSSI